MIEIIISSVGLALLMMCIAALIALFALMIVYSYQFFKLLIERITKWRR